MPAETLPLAAIIARAKELEQALNSEFAAALVGVSGRRDVKEARRLLDHFYVNYGARLVAVAEAAVEHAPQIEGFCIQAETKARVPGGQQAGIDKSWASRVNPSVKQELRWYARDFREFLDALASPAPGAGEEGE